MGANFGPGRWWRRSTTRWGTRRILLLIGTLAFLSLGAYLAWPRTLLNPTYELTISAGPDGSRRYIVAEYLVRQAEASGLQLTLVTNQGSEESLQQMRAGMLDVALISNGLVINDNDQVMVLGVVQHEVVQVLVRPELAEIGQPLSKLIRGRRVNLGGRGSTEAILSREFLRFANIKLPTESQPGDVLTTEMGYQELIRRTKEIETLQGDERAAKIAELPDCLMVLASIPSTVVEQLIETADYRILSLPGARAFLMDNLLDAAPQGTILDREFLEQGMIPANSYFAQAGQPATDLETVAVRLVIVARRDLPAAAVKSLMETLYEGEFPRRISISSPVDVATPYEIHPLAAAYLDRHRPVAIHDLMDSVANGLSIFGAFSAGALTLWSLLRSAPPRTPVDYYENIRQIDSIAHGLESDSRAPVHPSELRAYLEEKLLRLRHDLIQDICEGRIKGDQVIGNILALLKEARANLHRQKMDTDAKQGSLRSGQGTNDQHVA